LALQYDTQSIVRDDDRVTAWVSRRYDKPQTNWAASNFTEVRYHQVIDYSRRRLGMLSYVASHADGSTTNLETVADSM